MPFSVIDHKLHKDSEAAKKMCNKKDYALPLFHNREEVTKLRFI